MQFERPLVDAASHEDLAERLRQAEEAVRARDDFLAIAAHELRSPMNALGLQLATIERLAQKTSDTRLLEQTRRARRNVERYVRRAAILLDVTRLNSTDLRLQCEPVNVRALVMGVKQAHEDLARFHEASLEAEVQGELTAQWEPHMVEEILSNLVTNAIKYAGGRVRLRAAPGTPGFVCFTVSDDGPGIPEEMQSKMFARFERLVSPTRSRSGFGLGLWIVGRMVAAHGGSIQVQSVQSAQSAQGGGTVFTVNLPVQAPCEENKG